MWEQIEPVLPFILLAVLLVWFVIVRVFDRDETPIFNFKPDERTTDRLGNGNGSNGQETPHRRPLSLTEWLPLADQTPHLLIVGETDSGKTTLAQALVSARSGYVTILDPKWTPGKWGGAPVVPIDDDGEYGGIEQALQALIHELQQRLVTLKQGHTDFAPLTIVIEELPTVVDECPTARKVVLRLGQLGRELNMRVLGLSQGYGVEDLGLKGRSDNKANFGTIRLGAAAIKVARDAAQQSRPAVIEYRGNWEILDTRDLPRLAAQRIHPDRWYEPGLAVDTGAAETPGALSGGENQFGRTGSDGSADTRGILPGTPLSDDELILELVRRGYSANKIIDFLGGTRTERLAQIRRCKALLEEENATI